MIRVRRAVTPDDEAQWPDVYAWFSKVAVSVLRELRPTLLTLRYEPEELDGVPDEAPSDDGEENGG